ncbi:MAG TPA: CHAT domain-containing protein [Pyrinomonadaceae bacterium]|nr:CHAT domain-containing protein [Pyrinomonadaceae bacterium]
MLAICSRNHSWLVKASLVFFLASGAFTSVRAQTADEVIAKLSPSLSPDEAEIQKLVIRGYEAYATKNAPALLSMVSQQSPYLDQFKALITEENAANENVRLGVQINRVPNVLIDGDKATAHLDVTIHAVNKVTGKEVEGPGRMAHTFRFVKENGVWKIWQYIDTAQELTAELLTATSDEARALVLKRSEPFTDGLLKGLSDAASELLYRKGNDDQAALILNIVLTIARRNNSIEGTANALIGLGDVYAARGDYRQAADNYQEIMKLVESLGIKEGIAVVSVRMGDIHYYQGNFPQALNYYQRSVNLYEKVGSTQDVAHPLLRMGDVYFAQNDNTRALEYYQRSLKICEQTFDKAGATFLLNRIAEVYAAQARYEEADDFYRRSLKLQEDLGIKSITAITWNGIGSIRYRQGNYGEAARLSARAAELAKDGHAPEVLWKALTSLGQAYRALKQMDRAQQSFDEAIAVLEKMRGQLVGSERDQQLFFENKTVPYVEMVELLIAQNKVAEAFHYAELAKGRMLLDVLRHGRSDISKTMTAEERDHEKQLQATVTALSSQQRKEISLRQPDKSRLAFIDTQLQKARLEYDAYETRIYAAHPDLRAGRGGSEAFSLNEAGALINDSQTALLEYVVTQNRTYLFVLTKPNSTDPVRLKVYPIEVSARELATRVADFRQRLAGNSADFKELARSLYDLLLQPARDDLEGKSAICMVPAEVLWELPFQALLAKSARYVLEDHALSYAPSLSVLSEMKKKARARRGTGNASPSGGFLTKISTTMTPALPRLLALGNPSLSSGLVSQLRSAPRDASLDSLPHAEQEVKALREIYGATESTILIGTAAREETFKATASKYPVLHLAAHGVLDDVNPLYSRLLLATGSESEDGFLEAREIMKLDLHADLAVLSACQTARGQVGSGEGLIGMSWALFIAGTSTTVASQWQVDSASTARLMIDFHSNLQSEKGPSQASAAEALRRAAIKLMADPKYRHPFYWSGFVVVGDGI